MKHISLILFAVLLLSCKKEKIAITIINKTEVTQQLIKEKGNIIKTRFSVPKGFVRVKTNQNTFENYLQNFKLKPDNSKVHLYNGKLKYRQDIHVAILEISVGEKDLQQCADATMRLRAEFLYQQKRYDDIHFNFTNGFNVAYSKWRQGYRLNIKGNKVSWHKTNKESTSYNSFGNYMQYIFMYAGTLSLNKELKKVSLKNAKIGDVFIQGGNPGHAVIIVDMAVKTNSTLQQDSVETEKEIIFLLAQSYMPAQEIHVLKNFNNTSLSPWYSSKNLEILKTPEWNFNKENLKKFK